MNLTTTAEDMTLLFNCQGLAEEFYWLDPLPEDTHKKVAWTEVCLIQFIITSQKLATEAAATHPHIKHLSGPGALQGDTS